MERRDTIFGLEERQRALMYGVLGADRLRPRRHLHACGTSARSAAMLWLAMIGGAAYALYGVWRAYRTY